MANNATIGPTVSIELDLVDDTSPQLGGNLDVNGNSIVSASNGNIAITPNGSGKVVIDGLSHPTSDGSTGQFLKTDGSGNLSFATVSSDLVNDTSPQLGGDLDLNSNDITGTGNINITGNLTFEGATADDHETTITVTDPTADRTITLPNASGTVSLLDATETLTNKTLTAPVITGLASTTVEVDEQIFTSNGTWTKPAGAIITYMYCIGGGGGGGSGGRGSSFDSGGGGGAGGGVDLQMFISAALDSTCSVTVGSGGSGGAARTTNTYGNYGAVGGNSFVTSNSIVVCRGSGANGGVGGGTAYASGGSSLNVGLTAGGEGFSHNDLIFTNSPGSGGHGDDDNSAGAGLPGWGPGGGGGGVGVYDTSYRGAPGGRGSVFFSGIASLENKAIVNPNNNGGTTRGQNWRPRWDSVYSIFSGNYFFHNANSAYRYRLFGGGGGNGGASAGGNGSNGSDRTYGGDGGGGGVVATASLDVGGSGGNGGYPGGGGGGGGNQDAGDANSGAGGDGAAGKVWIWTVRFKQ
tara:strand:+ start:1066 stop:2631 length:1566 start_codon:yes stop_codon:yes gene_type:complete